jgi:hypothetical protein
MSFYTPPGRSYGPPTQVSFKVNWLNKNRPLLAALLTTFQVIALLGKLKSDIDRAETNKVFGFDDLTNYSPRTYTRR